MLPLWRWNLTGWRHRRIATEEASRELHCTDEIRKRRVLAVAGNIDDVRQTGIGPDREVNDALATGTAAAAAGIEAFNVAVEFGCLWQIHCDPRCSLSVREPDVLRPAIDQNGNVKPAVTGDCHLGVVVPDLCNGSIQSGVGV